jgi:hypothetical protein
MWCVCLCSSWQSRENCGHIGCRWSCVICRVGHNRIYTPYMTVYLVISLPKLPYIHRIYMVLANPSYLTGNAAWNSWAHEVQPVLAVRKNDTKAVIYRSRFFCIFPWIFICPCWCSYFHLMHVCFKFKKHKAAVMVGTQRRIKSWKLAWSYLGIHSWRDMSWFSRTRYLNTPHMTVYLVISLPEIPYIHRIHIYGSGQP